MPNIPAVFTSSPPLQKLFVSEINVAVGAYNVDAGVYNVLNKLKSFACKSLNPSPARVKVSCQTHILHPLSFFPIPFYMQDFIDPGKGLMFYF